MLSVARLSTSLGPQVVAVIPARGGSKGVPGKNLRRVGGRSLVARAVDACRRAAYVDAVYVSTDDDAIAGEATLAGAGVIRRPASLSGDTASSESALLHALDVLADSGVRPDTLVFAQCTSPFLDPADLDRGVELVRDGVAASVFSAVATYAFLWRAGADGLTGQNHDPGHRPRRQDRTADYRETGGFYVLDVAGFRAARHRFFAPVGVVVVPERSSVDVDTEADLEVAAALAPVLDSAPGLGLDVDVVITDFDGVHTDDSALVDSLGTEAVRVSRADGLGVERLRAAGVPLLIVSKETNAVVRARAAKLGVEVMSGVERKAEVVLRWLAEHDVAPDRVAYVGNDVNDLDVMA
ncbi:MAG TPA: acylneuraminate cytidylyltransferase, partial [Friedmanniella sp.]